MAYVFASDNKPYDGDTHTLGGTVYSGATRTPESRRLTWIEPSSQPKAPEVKTRKPKAKAAPKPKGASAWD